MRAGFLADLYMVQKWVNGERLDDVVIDTVAAICSWSKNELGSLGCGYGQSSKTGFEEESTKFGVSFFSRISSVDGGHITWRFPPWSRETRHRHPYILSSLMSNPPCCIYPFLPLDRKQLVPIATSAYDAPSVIPLLYRPPSHNITSSQRKTSTSPPPPRITIMDQSVFVLQKISAFLSTMGSLMIIIQTSRSTYNRIKPQQKTCSDYPSVPAWHGYSHHFLRLQNRV